jgi:hypothetical protein
MNIPGITKEIIEIIVLENGVNVAKSYPLYYNQMNFTFSNSTTWCMKHANNAIDTSWNPGVNNELTYIISDAQ